MLFELAVLACGLVVLSKSARWVIESSVILARRFGIGEMAVGFLLVSVATSLPEFLIAVISSLDGRPGLAVGNVVGANFSDLTLVVGASLLAGTVSLARRERENIRTLISAAAVGTIVFAAKGADRLTGLLLLAAFAAYALVLLRTKPSPVEHSFQERKGGGHLSDRLVGAIERLAGERWNTHARIAVLAASVAGVVLSAKVVTGEAEYFAALFGIPDAIIAATVLSLGTTLPELSVGVAAVRAGKNGIAFGNAIGSAITNLTLILGTAAVLSKESLSAGDIWMAVLFGLGAYALAYYFVSERRALSWREGWAFIGLYAAFILSQAAELFA